MTSSRHHSVATYCDDIMPSQFVTGSKGHSPIAWPLLAQALGGATALVRSDDAHEQRLEVNIFMIGMRWPIIKVVSSGYLLISWLRAHASQIVTRQLDVAVEVRPAAEDERPLMFFAFEPSAELRVNRIATTQRKVFDVIETYGSLKVKLSGRVLEAIWAESVDIVGDLSPSDVIYAAITMLNDLRRGSPHDGPISESLVADLSRYLYAAFGISKAKKYSMEYDMAKNTITHLDRHLQRVEEFVELCDRGVKFAHDFNALRSIVQVSPGVRTEFTLNYLPLLKTTLDIPAVALLLEEVMPLHIPHKVLAISTGAFTDRIYKAADVLYDTLQLFARRRIISARGGSMCNIALRYQVQLNGLAACLVRSCGVVTDNVLADIAANDRLYTAINKGKFVCEYGASYRNKL